VGDGFPSFSKVIRKRDCREKVKSYLFKQTKNYGTEENGFFELDASKEKIMVFIHLFSRYSGFLSKIYCCGHVIFPKL